MSDQATQEEINRTLANMKTEPIDEESQASFSASSTINVTDSASPSPAPNRNSPRVSFRADSPMPRRLNLAGGPAQNQPSGLASINNGQPIGNYGGGSPQYPQPGVAQAYAGGSVQGQAGYPHVCNLGCCSTPRSAQSPGPSSYPYPDPQVERLRRELHSAHINVIQLEAQLSQVTHTEHSRVLQRSGLKDKFNMMRLLLEHAQTDLDSVKHDLKVLGRYMAEAEMAAQHELQRLVELFGTPIPTPYGSSDDDDE